MWAMNCLLLNTSLLWVHVKIHEWMKKNRHHIRLVMGSWVYIYSLEKVHLYKNHGRLSAPCSRHPVLPLLVSWWKSGTCYGSLGGKETKSNLLFLKAADLDNWTVETWVLSSSCAFALPLRYIYIYIYIRTKDNPVGRRERRSALGEFRGWGGR